MKTLFTKGFYIVSAIILFIGTALPARAQFTNVTLSTNALATALAKDASGNIYALQTDASGTQGEVVKYTNGTGAPTVIYDGFPDNDQQGDYGTGLVVTSTGDIYFTTDNDGPTLPYGNIIKLKFNGGTSYTASVYQTGTASLGYYSGLAIDASDNIYAIQYNINADGGNSGIGAYEVVEYAAGSAAGSAGTVLYDKLDAVGLLSGFYYTPPAGLAVNSLGDVYVADAFDDDGANNDGGHIYKLTKASSYAVSTVSTNQYATSLAVDAANNLYASQVNTYPAYALVKYTNGTGTPTNIYTGLSSDSYDFPYGIAIISPTNIYVNDGGTNGTTDNQGNIIQLIGIPATQATNVVFTNTTATGTTASWTNGSGASRAVFITQASTGSPAPVNSTTYTANTTYASGTQIGGSGWYCVYNGTGSTVNITGLTAGNTYRVMAVEYNGPAGSENYLTTTGTNNPNNVSPVASATISSINLVTTSPTNAISVQYTVTFGAAVTGLSTSNFSLTTTGGISGASITSIAGSGTTYTVTANTGTGDGTIALNLANATGLSPGISTTLPFAGQAYTIDKTAPLATGLLYASNNTNSAFAKTGDIVTLKFSTNEAVQTPTLTIAGHSVTVSNLGGNSYSGSYTMTSSDAEGRIPYVVQFTDLAGNQSSYNDLAAGDLVTFDKTAPTVTIGSPSVSSTSTGPVTYTVTYADVNFNTSTLATGNVSLITTGTAAGTVAVTGSGTTYTVSISSISGTGTLGISIGAGTASDLAGNLAPASGSSATFTVAPSLTPQTITFNALPTKTYGNADFAPGATSTNSGTPAITYSSNNTAVATIVSGNIHIVGAGTAHITASQAGDATHSAATNVTQSLTVNQAPLTITANNQSSIYGAALPALTVSYSGFVNGDTQASLTTAATASTTATAASPTGNYTINTSGAVDPNYAITYGPGTLTIGKAALTVTADNQSSTYGAALPALTVTYSGFVNGDTQASLTTAATASTSATAASPAGNYTINTSGAVDPNYIISYVAGTLTIGKATLTVTADNQSSIYGAALPALTVSYSGFVNGDTQASLTTAATASTTATAASPAGNYTISTSGAVDPNYTISYVAGTLTIGKAALTVTADNQSSTYGSALPVLTVNYNGFVNGDTQASLTTAATASTTATAASPAGNYSINTSGAVDPNYTISYVAGTLTIGKAALTITADNQSSVYGAALPALTVTYSGFVNGDTQASLTTAATASTTATAASPAGNYTINTSGAVDPNYNISYVAGTLTIGKAALTVTADNQSSTYGSALPALTVSYSGFVNGDTQASLTTAATASTTATAASPAGNYTINTSGAIDPNYTISYVAGTLTVGKASLTITADNQSIAHGAAIPTLTASYSGFVNGDNAASLTTAPILSTTATSASPAGSYPINASGAVDPNYNISYVAGTLAIGKTILVVTVNDQSSVYGSALPTFTVSYSGFVNGDNAASLTTAPTINTTATAASPAGTYAITASGAVDPNYAISYTPGTLTISKAALTITADNQSSVYGAALPALTVSYSGFVNGDTQASLTTAATASTTATASSPAGNYTINTSGAVDPNYTISYVAGTLTIGKAALTVTADNQSSTYGSALPALTVTYSGFVNGDTQASLTTAATSSTTATFASPAGSYPIMASGAVDANYTISYVAGTLTIGKANLTITADNQSIAHGAAIPTLTASYSGFVNGDNAASLTTAPALSTTGTSASPAGSYPITASGAVDPNYNISYVAGTLAIGKALLVVTVDNQSSVYGSALPTLTVSYSGFVNGDNAASLTTAPTISTTATAASPAGTYAITASGAVDPNYVISYTPGTLTISKAALTVTADNQNSTYGAALPTLTASYSGFVNGDNATSLTTAPTVTTTATAASPAGSYPITVSGAVDANYNISYVAGTLTIGKAALTVTADNQNSTYSSTLPALTASYTGFVNGDNAASLTTAPTLSTTATSASPANTYPINVSGAVDANYTISYVTGTLTIGKASLTITADNQSVAHGAAIPALTASYSGFVNGDNVASLTTAPTLSTTGTSASPAGSYPITASGAVDPNYNISYVAGTLAIGKALLTITVDNQTSVYGSALPTLTASYSGFVNGDNAASLTTQPTISTVATTASPAGTYPINASGAVDPNYTFVYVPGTLTIDKAALTVTADNQSSTYGAALPTLTASYSGFVNGDNSASLTTAPTISTTGTSASPAGSYPITASGAVDPNYTISYTAGTLTIGKAALTVTADNQSSTYGSALPTLTASYTGFVNGDNASSLTTAPILTTTGTASSPAGSYPITASGAVDANYTISYVAGSLTIRKANLTITADNQSVAHGAAIPALTASYSGFVNDDNVASLTTAPTITTTGTSASPAGNYPITASGAVDPNYNISYVAGTLAIGKSALLITVNNQTSTYGSAIPALTVSYSGFVNGDNASSLTTAPIITTTGTASSPAGTYPINASGAVDPNYTISYVAGTLTIGQAALTITADNQTSVYGGAIPALTASYSGFVNGDNTASLTTAPTIITTGTSSSPAGTYAITASGAVDPNYTITYVAGTLSIGKVPLTITANDQTTTYGLPLPTFTATYTGFVNGDNAASLTTAPTITTTATSTSPVGTYPITANSAVDANYTISYVAGTLTVKQAVRTLTFNPLPVETYGSPDFDPGAVASDGETVLYTSSNPAAATIVNGKIHITGAGNTLITATLAANSNYTTTPTASQGLVINKANQTISVLSIPTLIKGSQYDLSVITSSSGLPLTFTVSDPTIASVNGQTLNALHIGSTSLTVSQPGDNNYNAASTTGAVITVTDNAGDEIIVHQAVSPNGDGINDFFLIEGIKNYPDNQVTIVNRNGVKVYQTRSYDNAYRVFDGRSNITGTLQQAGTYFYLLEYTVNGESKRKTGFLVLKYQ
ncbi:gliding motility-associated C-terminal domain-containing protein [Mucilaginibacter mallensis]|uniref:Gliding motility-associated C-terminal domain-containing protein n=1 Tax=Mucilaginibacter mallensis TaxID=652787 RepID=A0A1H1YQB2_MUCMA|nr:MBG domain-containing protein [Mucilaginibacter mallensis]SDT23587.1 gliding motility-associated C-terminal domain-containing protein [Mucilaginibacter mallensis]